MIDKLKTDLSSFNYRKVEKSRRESSNTSNLPTPPTRVTEVTSTIVSVDYSKLANMSRGSNDVKQPSQDYLDTHRYNDGFGNVKLVGLKTAEDLARWSKWFDSAAGIRFHIKQQALQIMNASEHTKIYNPVGLFTSLNAFTHAPRHGTWPLGLRPGDLIDPPTYEKGHPKSDPMKNVDVTSDATGLGESIGKIFNVDIFNPKTAKKHGLGTGKVKTKFGKLYAVTVSNTLQVPYHGELNDFYAKKHFPKDFIKFRIRDLVNGKWLIFPAHLGTITDTVTPTWTPERYIGRSDSVHIYSGTDRTVSFDFKVAAFTKQEIPIIQEKMNYLVGLGYPSYKKLFDGDSESRPVAPFISLTIGDLFKNTPGYFSSITVTINETATWELDDGFQIPMYFDVGCEFTYIGKYLPQTLGKHYEASLLPDVHDASNLTPFSDKYPKGRAPGAKGKFHHYMNLEQAGGQLDWSE